MRRLIYVGTLLCAVSLTGCSNEELFESEVTKTIEGVSLTAITGLDTRTATVGKLVNWCEGDQFDAFGNEVKGVFAVDEGKAGSNSATFTGTLTSEGTQTPTVSDLKYAIHPSGIYTPTGSEITFPSVYTYPKSNIPMYGEMDNGVIRFNKYISGMLRVQVKNVGKGVSGSVRLSAAETLAGKGTLMVKNGTVEVKNLVATDYSDVTLNFTGDGSDPMILDIPVPAGTYTEGIKVILMLDGTPYTFKTAADFIIKQGTIKMMPVIDPAEAEPDLTVWDGISAADKFAGGTGFSFDPIRIETAAQLKLLANKTKAGTTYEGNYFKLMNDIDLSNKEWIPTGSFAGNFDGGNHTISGLNINSTDRPIGLFGCIFEGGSVSNLKVSGYVKSTMGDVGMICGNANGVVTFDNVETFGTVEGGNYYTGGLVGEWDYISVGSDNIITFKNSINRCNVAGASFVGGFVGVLHQRGTLKIINSINYGNISGTGTRIGGFAGYARNEAAVTNSCNYANVSSGYGIIEQTYWSSSCYLANCFWLNDMNGAMGTEAGIDCSTNDLGLYENSGYFVRTDAACYLFPSGTELVGELNKWVEENGSDTYRQWEYGTMDGYACPTLK